MLLWLDEFEVTAIEFACCSRGVSKVPKLSRNVIYKIWPFKKCLTPFGTNVVIVVLKSSTKNANYWLSFKIFSHLIIPIVAVLLVSFLNSLTVLLIDNNITVPNVVPTQIVGLFDKSSI